MLLGFGAGGIPLKWCAAVASRVKDSRYLAGENTSCPRPRVELKIKN